MAGLTQSMVRQISKLIKPLRQRVALTVGRCIIAATNDDPKFQELQIKTLADEVLDQIERIQNYGITSRPLDGAEGVTLSLGGYRSHTVVIAVDDRRYRVKGLKKGEVCIYTDEDQGGDDCRIHFKRGKEIHMIAGASSMVMTPAGTTLTTPSFDLNETA